MPSWDALRAEDREQDPRIVLTVRDVEATCANIDDLSDYVGYRPSTPIEVGIQRFVAWYREYYGV